MRDASYIKLKSQNWRLMRNHKKYYWVKTTGQWTWKPSFAKKSVTAYLSNLIVLKMDDAKSSSYT